MNRNEIEQKMIRDIGTGTSDITDFNLSSIIRAIIRGIAWVGEALWYSLNRLKRQMFLATATETDLDALGAERGLTRGAANSAGVVINFRDTTGASGSVIPIGTTIRSIEGIVYETQYEVTIGAANPILGGSTYAPAYQNSTYAVAISTGSNTNVPALSITEITSTVPANIVCVNPYPAQYGRDEETDDEFRYRIAHNIDILDQGTQAAYEAQAQAEPTAGIGDNILRTKAVRIGAHQVKVYIVTKDAAGLSGPDLLTLAAYLADHQSITTSVVCENIVFTPVTVSATISLEGATTLTEAYVAIADKLANYIDWENWDWGGDVDDTALLSVMRQADGVADIILSSFSPSDNVEVGNNSLPRLINLTIIDAGGVYPTIDSSTYVPAGLDTTYDHVPPVT
jgi:uncharacterized phage protein gp47/JayE